MQQNENLAKQPEQAEAERPKLEPHIPAQTIAEAAIEQLIKSGTKHYQEFHFDLHLDGHEGARPVVVTVAFSDGPSAHELRMKAEQERDAALARVAEVETMVRMLEEREWAEHVGESELGQRLEAAITTLINEASEFGDMPKDWRVVAKSNCFVLMEGNSVIASLAGPQSELNAARIAGALSKAPPAQAQHSVPRAWLDVQAERRRQVEVEGYHGFRDSHYINYELSKAARAYIEVSWHALSGGLPCKKPESWPWMAGFKWSDGRTMLVKAGALILAEIERLDRAGVLGKEG
ncbi:hypothetical protein [Pseudomonas aeruginosa]|uniref:hypothetical protein n=1 Tax=Pseudomonas aeruginosa TaxID=287 RepID=UPI00068A85E3|nr:hypothetical protein [Pseudomonas aeruginosa]